MKKIIFLFALIPTLFFGQIQVQQKTEIGSFKNGAALLAEIISIPSEPDIEYTLKFLNYNKINDNEYITIKFSGVNNTLNDFYKILKSLFSDVNKKNKDFKVDFKLGDKSVSVSNYRLMGTTSAKFSTDNEAYM